MRIAPPFYLRPSFSNINLTKLSEVSFRRSTYPIVLLSPFYNRVVEARGQYVLDAPFDGRRIR